jgi:hypothetical protein
MSNRVDSAITGTDAEDARELQLPDRGRRWWQCIDTLVVRSITLPGSLRGLYDPRNGQFFGRGNVRSREADVTDVIVEEDQRARAQERADFVQQFARADRLLRPAVHDRAGAVRLGPGLVPARKKCRRSRLPHSRDTPIGAARARV